MSQFLESYT